MVVNYLRIAWSSATLSPNKLQDEAQRDSVLLTFDHCCFPVQRWWRAKVNKFAAKNFRWYACANVWELCTQSDTNNFLLNIHKIFHHVGLPLREMMLHDFELCFHAVTLSQCFIRYPTCLTCWWDIRYQGSIGSHSSINISILQPAFRCSQNKHCCKFFLELTTTFAFQCQSLRIRWPPAIFRRC